MKHNFDAMPDLPGDIRYMILVVLAEVKEKLNWIEDQLCLSDEEENQE